MQRQQHTQHAGAQACSRIRTSPSQRLPHLLPPLDQHTRQSCCQPHSVNMSMAVPQQPRSSGTYLCQALGMKSTKPLPLRDHSQLEKGTRTQVLSPCRWRQGSCGGDSGH